MYLLEMRSRLTNCVVEESVEAGGLGMLDIHLLDEQSHNCICCNGEKLQCGNW